MYILATSAISYQATFQNEGFSRHLIEIDDDAELIRPDYSLYIPAMERRRMSEVVKMAIACSIDCLSQAHFAQPDAIIVGTSMGCCTHTKAFLDKILTSDGNLISPTSFIQSTHNTIAGQISLLLKNHSYNTTHTQNSLSFEHALMDGFLCANEGCTQILVGASDENEPELHNLKERLKNEIGTAGYGASFFILSPEQTDVGIELVDIASFGLIQEYGSLITDFLSANKLTHADIDQVLYSNSTPLIKHVLNDLFQTQVMIDYQKYSGLYFTNSAFAMSLAIDMLKEADRSKSKYVLVCNNLVPENLGLTLLRRKALK